MLRKNRVFRTSASSRSIVLLRKTTPPAVLQPLVLFLSAHKNLHFLHNTVYFNIIVDNCKKVAKTEVYDAKSTGATPS